MNITFGGTEQFFGATVLYGGKILHGGDVEVKSHSPHTHFWRINLMHYYSQQECGHCCTVVNAASSEGQTET